MNEMEYLSKVIDLERKIEFNKSIRCTLVAARYQRQLDELKKDYEKKNS